MAKLAAMESADGRVEFAEEPEARLGNAGADDATVGVEASTGDKTAGLEAIQDPGDIRVAGNHALTDLAASATFRLGAAEDAEDVVLGGGQFEGFEELFDVTEEEIGSLLERNKEPLPERHGGAGSVRATHHQSQYSRCNDYCQEERGPGLAAPQGFCTGRRWTSLMNEVGAWVTSMATAWATSSGWRSFAMSRPLCGENAVATLPGQTTLTRMP